MNSEIVEPSGKQLNKTAARIKQGDIEAGKELFDHFSPLLYRFFLVRTANREVSEDLTQDVFMKILAKIETFDEEKGNFPGWAWQIARNTLVDYFREKKTIAFTDIGEGINDIVSDDGDGDKKRDVRGIMDAVRQMSEEEQELFALRYISDVSYREMSGILGKSEAALRVALHRLNKKVKESMGEL